MLAATYFETNNNSYFGGQLGQVTSAFCSGIQWQHLDSAALEKSATVSPTHQRRFICQHSLIIRQHKDLNHKLPTMLLILQAYIRHTVCAKGYEGKPPVAMQTVVVYKVRT